MISILLLGTQMATGGAQKVLLDQAQWFVEKGHKVTVIFFYDRDGLHNIWKEIYHFPIHNLEAYKEGSGRIDTLILILRGLTRLWAHIKSTGFNAIITYTQDSNLLGLPIAWAAGIPVRIATQLGEIPNIPWWRRKIHSWIINIGMAQNLIAASVGTKENAIQDGTLAKHIIVIQNGVRPFIINSDDRVRTRLSIGVRSEEIFILSVGRLVYEKGHDLLISALPDVINEFPHTKIGICGTGPLKEYLTALIFQNGLENYVKLFGYYENVHDLLAAADIFVLPSRWEGLSVALLEGMLAKLPVVACRVEGVDEVVDDKINGLLVPIDDSYSISKAIKLLLRDPGKRQNMGLAGYARVMQGYTTDDMCRKYFNVISQHL